MQKVHELKCWPSQFEATLDGRKKHEFRKNDRDFKVGDVLSLREYDPAKSYPYTHGHTGRVLRGRVTWVTESFGVPPGFCAMSLSDVSAVMWDCPQCGCTEVETDEDGATVCVDAGHTLILAPDEPEDT